MLAMKKRGFGVGKWNGPGGRIEREETPEEGAVRETWEEVGITLRSLNRVALLFFEFINKPELDRIVAVYTAHEWDGEVAETEEMMPKQFKISKIPLPEMWEADTHWLPRVLEGKLLVADFAYTADQKLQSFNIREVNFQELSDSFNRSMLSQS